MNKKEKGFTIVELVLAMALVTFIFLFTLTVLTQLLTTYNRGLALTQINQAIRQLDNDVGKGLRFSSPGAFNYYYFDSSGKSKDSAGDQYAWDHYDVVAGSFCTGTAAYIWNVGAKVGFTDASGESVKLARVTGDKISKYCNENVASTWKSISKNDSEVTKLLGSQAMVLRAEISGGNAISAYTDGCDAGQYHDYTDSNGNGDRNECIAIPSGGVINERGRLAKVYFALSTSGDDYQAEWNDSDGGYWTCESSAHAGQYCSFGEFDSIIYLRGK